MNNAKYSLISQFNLLESKISQLNLLIAKQTTINAAVFRLPDTIKGDENSEINEIIVNKITGQEAIKAAIAHFSLLFIHDKSDVISNKSAIRLPGAICIETPYSTYIAFQTLLDEINSLKLQIKQIVTKLSGVDESQRFEFIHSSLHGLLTLNTYRALTYLVDVDTVRFGWANKKVINKTTKEKILNKLQAILENGRKPQGMDNKYWVGQIEQEILLISKLSHNAVLKTQRPVKVQPIARVWDKDQQKQTQFACANPLIIFAVEKSLDDILIGTLPDYHVDVIALRNRPRSKPVELLISRLNLYIEQ
ncbi:DNA replication terminus site-binding protein [Providencia burhodogranariea]|uniref:DNA replication terminus site-binding protein n=1 Tax=Providencia burhodogranariea DSM 19968 TaxID=1141662 RepID=K8WRN5_9GAMM|nr:DNA replication terminus site-binding protein [Providencia burhodogranariea]EKT63248.1 DNA replication terminus site-binding protein [Providencia burhodogranariea DSM 19968]